MSEWIARGTHEEIFQAALADTKKYCVLWRLHGWPKTSVEQHYEWLSRGKEYFQPDEKLELLGSKLRAMHAAHKVPVPSYFTQTTISGYDLYKIEEP